MKPTTLVDAGPTPEDRPAPVETDAYPSAGYAWYVVGVLTLAYVFSFIDRQILNLLVEPIQRDLGIGEKQMSLLMGISFVVFYTLLGIPLGRLADTHSRRAIIAVGIAFWSVMTAGCGLTRSFWQLALMRIGVGVGEASLSPSAYSLIADSFRPERRSTALSVYSMGIYVGSGLAFALGGLVVKFASGQANYHLPVVGAVHSWQLVFFLVGLPGLPGALLLLTVREPSRKGVPAAKAGTPTRPGASAGEAWSYIRDNRITFLCLNVGIGLVALSSYAASSWIPTLLIRRFGWSLLQTGLVFGAIVAVSGTLGIVTGGRLADHLRQRGRGDANLRVALLGAAAWLPFGILYPLMPAGAWAAVLMAPAIFFNSMPFGVAPAAILQMMPNPMRAQASAVYLFVINLLGLGLGPLAVATLTEDVFRDKNAIHSSLLVVGVAANLSAVVLLGLGLKRYRRSLDYLSAWTAAHA